MFVGAIFLFWRFMEIITLIPTLGMLAYFVHWYDSRNLLTPDYILLLFIASVLGAVWAIATALAYARARHSAIFVATIDLGFVGLFIAAVYYLRGIANANCTNFYASGSNHVNLGAVGSADVTDYHLETNKTCALLKASFAFGIMNCIFFFFTFVAALMAHNKYDDDRVTVKRSYHGSRRSSHGRHSRDYGSPRRSSHRSHRRSYYV